MGPPARWAPELDATVTEPRPRPPASAGRFDEQESGVLATAQATSPSVHRNEDGGRHDLNVWHQLDVLTKLVDEVESAGRARKNSAGPGCRRRARRTCTRHFGQVNGPSLSLDG